MAGMEMAVEKRFIFGSVYFSCSIEASSSNSFTWRWLSLVGVFTTTCTYSSPLPPLQKGDAGPLLW